MNFSSPTSKFPSFALSDLTVTLPTALLNEEAQVSLAENEWLGRAKRLSPSERDDATNRIKTMAREILNKLDRMLRMGCSSEQIKLEAVKSIKQLHISSEKLFEGYTSYCRIKKGLENDFKGVEAKIQLSTLHFTPFSSCQSGPDINTNPASIFQNFLQSKSKEQLQTRKTLNSPKQATVQSAVPAQEKDLFYKARQSGVEESMGLARFLGSILNAASFLIVEGAKSHRKDIEANNKAFQELLYACHITSKKEPLAGKVLNPPMNVYVDDWVEDFLIRADMKNLLPTYTKLKRPSYALAYQLKNQFGISEERTKQFEADAFNITLTAMPLPALGSARLLKYTFVSKKFSPISLLKRKISPILNFKPGLNKNKTKLTHIHREEKVYPKERKLIKVEKTASYVDSTYQFTWPMANYTTAIRNDGTFIAVVGNINNKSLTSVTRKFKNGPCVLLTNSFEQSERSTFMLAQKIFFEIKDKAKKAFNEQKCSGKSYILEFQTDNPRILEVMKGRYTLIDKSRISSLGGGIKKTKNYQFEIPLDFPGISSQVPAPITKRSIKNFLQEESGAIPLSGFMEKPLIKKMEDRIAKLEKLQEIIEVPRSKRKMLHYHKKIGYQIVEKGGKGSHIKLEKQDCPMVIISDNVETHSYDGIWKRFKMTLGKEIAKEKKLLQEVSLQENICQPIHPVIDENFSVEECFALSQPRNINLKKFKGKKDEIPTIVRYDNHPDVQKTIPIDRLGNEKKRQRLLNYHEGLEAEHLTLQELSSSTPVFEWPRSLPRHINEFYANFQTHSFSISKLGSSGKGSVRGHLLYKNTNDKTLFILQSRTSSHKVREELGNLKLIHSVYLSWDERLTYLIDQTLSFSMEQGFKRIFLAWDPAFHPLATVMTKKEGIKILGINQFSVGINQKPLAAVELRLPKAGN